MVKTQAELLLYPKAPFQTKSHLHTPHFGAISIQREFSFPSLDVFLQP